MVDTWTGDFDGMVERHRIRALVAFSKTFYFLDRATQRGASYEALKEFEKTVNKELKKKTVKVEVVGRKIADTTVSVPEIVLQNLGSPESGITMRELSALLTRKLLEGVSKAGGGIPTDLASDLRGSPRGLASSGSAGEARDTAEKALDSVKGLFGRD